MKAAVFMAAALISVMMIQNIGIRAATTQESELVTSLDKVMKKLKKQSKSYVSKIKKKTETKEDPKEDPQNDPKEDPKDTPKEDPKIPDSFTEDDLRLLSAIIYCEASDMSEEAGIAVANVILNRMRDKKNWGHVNTIREVIYDDKWGVQFTPSVGSPSLIDKALEIYDNLDSYEGKWQYRQMMKNISAAKKALAGETVIPDEYMYFNGSIESSKEKCESKGKSYIIIDHHIYF